MLANGSGSSTTVAMVNMSQMLGLKARSLNTRIADRYATGMDGKSVRKEAG
jgi:hypothetical protein